MNHSLFHQLKHPFVWTTPEDRAAVLANLNDPIWHRFVEEAERHFLQRGELQPANFPVFCHHGDLDEVMAVAVLATVRNEPKLWHWLGDWLRGALAHYRKMLPEWRENRFRIMRGETLMKGNQRQFFQGFTGKNASGSPYWVEAGFSSMLLHLLDQLEAHSPDEFTVEEKERLLEALGDYGDRYAFHEEALKYNNRGMWANAGILLAGIAHPDARTGDLLRFQAMRRHTEFRTTFLDDGFNIEGSPDYHLMSADALLAYLLTASHLEPDADLYAAGEGDGLFECYPSFVDIVKAYLKTVIPGPVLWNYSRGCSVSTPVTVRPALVQAWKLTRDPEIGWFLRRRMDEVKTGYPTPLKVTNAALLGLGHYQPLLNFWLYRPVENTRPPVRKRDVLPDFGSLISRSDWGEDADCVTARFGYEGTAKGHRDHGHVTFCVGGVNILKDPFPRFGPGDLYAPMALETSIFHNTVTLDNREPAAVAGSLQASASAEGLDAFLISNAGGSQPDRVFLHDPRDESNYWFTNHPQPPEFDFQRAIIHLHGQGLIVADRIAAPDNRRIDWFFHSDLVPEGYDPGAEVRADTYQLRRRMTVATPGVLELPLRGAICKTASGTWGQIRLAGSAVTSTLQYLSPDAPLELEAGHLFHREPQTGVISPSAGETDHFLRVRAETGIARALWVISQTETPCPVKVVWQEAGCEIQIGETATPTRIGIDFSTPQLQINS